MAGQQAFNLSARAEASSILVRGTRSMGMFQQNKNAITLDVLADKYIPDH